MGRGVAGRICTRVFRTVWGPQQSGLAWQTGWGGLRTVEAVLPGEGPALAGVKCCPSRVEKWRLTPATLSQQRLCPVPPAGAFCPSSAQSNENLWSGKWYLREGPGTPGIWVLSSGGTVRPSGCPSVWRTPALCICSPAGPVAPSGTGSPNRPEGAHFSPPLQGSCILQRV